MPAARLVERQLVAVVAGVEGLVVVDLQVEVAELILVLHSSTHVVGEASSFFAAGFYIRRFVLEIFVVVHA